MLFPRGSVESTLPCLDSVTTLVHISQHRWIQILWVYHSLVYLLYIHVVFAPYLNPPTTVPNCLGQTQFDLTLAVPFHPSKVPKKVRQQALCYISLDSSCFVLYTHIIRNLTSSLLCAFRPVKHLKFDWSAHTLTLCCQATAPLHSVSPPGYVYCV